MPKQLQTNNQTVYFSNSESMNELSNNSIDFIITSPPYWNLKDYGHKNQIGHDEEYEEYLQRLNKVWKECYRVIKENGVMIINIGDRRANKKFYPIGMDIYNKMDDWKLIDKLIWHIPNALPQPAYYIDKLFDDKYEDLLLFAPNYEYNYTFNKIRVQQEFKENEPRENKMNDDGRCIGNILQMRAYRPPTIKNENYHAAAYPEELISLLVEAFTNKGDKVLDPFLGSGTTLKVTESMNRKGIGYEIDPEYESLIESRINEPFTKPDWGELDVLQNREHTNNKTN